MLAMQRRAWERGVADQVRLELGETDWVGLLAKDALVNQLKDGRLVEQCLARGLDPFVTRFHWDMPQALQHRCGGFAGRDCAAYFADYAARVAHSLGDRVKHWVTLNELIQSQPA